MKTKLYPMRASKYARQGLIDMCEYLNSRLPLSQITMHEIGSYAGESTVIFSKYFKTVIAIDPWLDNYDENDITCKYMPLPQVEKEFDKVTRRVTNIIKKKTTSNKYLKNIVIVNPDLHMIYIDGIHTYKQVRADIKNAKKSGFKFITGHDYNPKGWPEVIRAVNEAFGKPHKVFQDRSWIGELKIVRPQARKLERK